MQVLFGTFRNFSVFRTINEMHISPVFLRDLNMALTPYAQLGHIRRKWPTVNRATVVIHPQLIKSLRNDHGRRHTIAMEERLHLQLHLPLSE